VTECLVFGQYSIEVMERLLGAFKDRRWEGFRHPERDAALPPNLSEHLFFFISPLESLTFEEFETAIIIIIKLVQRRGRARWLQRCQSGRRHSRDPAFQPNCPPNSSSPLLTSPSLHLTFFFPVLLIYPWVPFLSDAARCLVERHRPPFLYPFCAPFPPFPPTTTALLLSFYSPSSA